MDKDPSLDRLLERTMRAHAATRGADACLDAETLAAWVDDSLPFTDRAAAEAHAADCTRCLEVLVALAQTVPPPSVPEKPSWFSVRWMVPLTSAALAMTAWVIIRGPQEPSLPVSPAAIDSKESAESSARAERDAGGQRLSDRFQDQKAAQPAPARSKPALSSSDDQAKARRADESQRKDSADLFEKAAPKRDATAAANETRRGVSEPAAVAAPPTVAQPSLRRESADSRVETTTLQSRKATHLVTSPDPAARWRMTGASIEGTVDGGVNWRSQPTGTTAYLLAGSSPARTVCWIVGRSGTVLLSTDGETWRRLDFPDPTADLVSVAARDAVAATVTTANGRTYRTTDAGLTWTLQENPPAPF